MTLPELLEQAKQLAAEGWLDADWFSHQAERIRLGAGKSALVETYVRAYEEELLSVVADGTALMLDRRVRVHRLLCEAECEGSRFEAALLQLHQELRMEVLRAQHKKALATQKEARA
jgi:hypothetical protein